MTYPDIADLDHVQWDMKMFPYVCHGEAWERVDLRKEGDCKDVVLAQIHHLQEFGWPIEKLQIGICRVEEAARKPHETHAVLVVDNKWVLDSRQSIVLTLDEFYLLGYEPIEIQREGGSRTFVEWTWTQT
jgi:Predicted periplasmic protein